MEIIEKQVEKVKEVPADGCYSGYGYGRRDINGKANAGLTLGIIGTALGAWALFGNRGNSGLLGLGSSTAGTLDGANININGVSPSYGMGYANGVTSPSAFQAWEKSCDNALALTNTIWGLKVAGMQADAAHREIDVAEKFSIYKGQVDADFGLYKSTRDGFDVINAEMNKNNFSLYKSQRDADDALAQRISNLEQQVAVNAAIRPYQDRLIQCEIDKAFTAGINYTDRKTCKAIYGEVTLPNTPTVTGFVGANQCGCPRVVTPATAGA